MYKFLYPITLLPVALAMSCTGEKDNVTHIQIDPETVTTLTADTADMIRLQASDSSMLHTIDRLEIVGDTLYINSRELVRKFSAADGRFLGNLTTQGNGPGEYVSLTNFWKSADGLHLQDYDQRKIIDFTPDGRFAGERLPSTDDKSLPNYFAELPGDSGYIALNTWFGGTAPSNPFASIYDKDLRFRADVPGRDVTCGSYLTDRAYTDRQGGRLLLWEALRDTLYSVDASGFHPIYRVDFGKKYNLPHDIQANPDMTDRSIAVYNNGNPLPYATQIRLYQTDGHGNLYFSYLLGGDYYIARYNEATALSDVFHFQSPAEGMKQYSFFHIDGDNLYIQFADEDHPDENPLLYRTTLSSLQ